VKNVFPLTFIKKVFEFDQACALSLKNLPHMVVHTLPHFGFFEEVEDLDL